MNSDLLKIVRTEFFREWIRTKDVIFILKPTHIEKYRYYYFIVEWESGFDVCRIFSDSKNNSLHLYAEAENISRLNMLKFINTKSK